MGLQAFIQKIYSGNGALLLPKGAIIVGSLQVLGNGEIDGLVKGDVSVGGKLVIGANADLKGNVQACQVEIRGRVEGDVFCEEGATIAHTAAIKGNITALVFDIKEGAVINGAILKKTEAPIQEFSSGVLEGMAPIDSTTDTDNVENETPVADIQAERSTDLDKDAQKWF